METPRNPLADLSETLAGPTDTWLKDVDWQRTGIIVTVEKSGSEDWTVIHERDLALLLEEIAKMDLAKVPAKLQAESVQKLQTLDQELATPRLSSLFSSLVKGSTVEQAKKIQLQSLIQAALTQLKILPTQPHQAEELALTTTDATETSATKSVTNWSVNLNWNEMPRLEAVRAQFSEAMQHLEGELQQLRKSAQLRVSLDEETMQRVWGDLKKSASLKLADIRRVVDLKPDEMAGLFAQVRDLFIRAYRYALRYETEQPAVRLPFIPDKDEVDEETYMAEVLASKGESNLNDGQLPEIADKSCSAEVQSQILNMRGCYFYSQDQYEKACDQFYEALILPGDPFEHIRCLKDLEDSSILTDVAERCERNGYYHAARDLYLAAYAMTSSLKLESAGELAHKALLWHERIGQAALPKQLIGDAALWKSTQPTEDELSEEIVSKESARSLESEELFIEKLFDY